MGEEGTGGGFAVGAADSNDVQMREMLPIVDGFFLEEGEWVVVGKSLFGGEFCCVRGRYYHSCGALFQGKGGKSGAMGVGARESEKDFARLEGAGIYAGPCARKQNFSECLLGQVSLTPNLGTRQ